MLLGAILAGKLATPALDYRNHPQSVSGSGRPALHPSLTYRLTPAGDRAGGEQYPSTCIYPSTCVKSNTEKKT